MLDLDRFKQTYFEECAELLDVVYGHLAALDEARADDETIHAVFRAVHSIKGGGGAFGFERLVTFTHAFETLLDLVRNDQLPLDAAILQLMLRGTDMVSDLIAGARTGQEPAQGAENEVLRALQAAANLPSCDPTVHAPMTKTKVSSLDPGTAIPSRWRIRFVPHTSLYASANEPLLIFRELERHGTLTVAADLSRLPDLAALDPEQAYVTWTLEIATTATRETLTEAFEFVLDECELVIEIVDDASAEPDVVESAASVPVASDATPVAEAARTGAPPAAPGGEAKPAGHSIRIDVEKIDRLVNLVGELVINQAMLAQVGINLPPDLCPGLTGGLEILSQHLRELQEGVMAIRAQPVRSVFSRMPRLVREVAGQLGKEVRLIVSGEGTEIDKTVIEQLADPLTHLLRNSLDHGIESPVDREARGKPRQGTIHLSAEHRSGRIVIEVSDDGNGIDRDRVLTKARQRGLILADQNPSSEEIDDLIFLPGFSTAETISSISGRGVGMDVVRRNMQALGGRIGVTSRLGAGSRFTMSLPLTLAILDGMAVAVGDETYIIPLTNIMESLRPRREELHPVVGRGDVLAIRGEYIPLVYLFRVFDVPKAEADPCRGIVVIVDSESAGRFGIVVDEMLGQQQVVVKSLEANYGPVDGVGGATILGNGRVALILDVARLSGGGVISQRRDPALTAGDPSRIVRPDDSIGKGRQA